MHLNVSKEAFASSKLCMEWATTLLDGRGKNLIHFDAPGSIFPERPIAANTFGDSFDENTADAVYLLNENVDLLIDKGNYIVGGVGDEMATLSRLLIGDVDDQYTKSFTLKKHFTTGNWSALDSTVLPCSDIIISDAYVLSNFTLYEKNIVSFIHKLTKHVYNSKVNVVIFCLKETQYSDKKDNTLKQVTPCWDKIREQIKKKLAEDNVEANVTFVALANTKIFGEHDRTVYTNYAFYVPGACLNFFNSLGELTSNGRYFVVKSKAKTGYREEADLFLSDMQELINKVSSDAQNGEIIKDNSPKLSNFLTFP